MIFVPLPDFMAFPTVLLEILRLSTALALAIKNISAHLYFYLPDLLKKQKNETRQTCAVSGFNWLYYFDKKPFPLQLLPI